MMHVPSSRYQHRGRKHVIQTSSISALLSFPCPRMGMQDMNPGITVACACSSVSAINLARRHALQVAESCAHDGLSNNGSTSEDTPCGAAATSRTTAELCCRSQSRPHLGDCRPQTSAAPPSRHPHAPLQCGRHSQRRRYRGPPHPPCAADLSPAASKHTASVSHC